MIKPKIQSPTSTNLDARQTSRLELPLRTQRTWDLKPLISQVWQGLQSPDFRSLKVRHLFWTSCLIFLYDQWGEISKVMIHSSYLALAWIILSTSRYKLFSPSYACILFFQLKNTSSCFSPRQEKKAQNKTKTKQGSLPIRKSQSFTKTPLCCSYSFTCFTKAADRAVPAGWCAWHHMVPHKGVNEGGSKWMFSQEEMSRLHRVPEKDARLECLTL